VKQTSVFRTVDGYTFYRIPLTVLIVKLNPLLDVPGQQYVWLDHPVPGCHDMLLWDNEGWPHEEQDNGLACGVRFEGTYLQEDWQQRVIQGMYAAGLGLLPLGDWHPKDHKCDAFENTYQPECTVGGVIDLRAGDDMADVYVGTFAMCTACGEFRFSPAGMEQYCELDQQKLAPDKTDKNWRQDAR
jgi:hypothetical protein